MTYLVDDLGSSLIELTKYATALGRLRQAKPIGGNHYFLFNQNFFGADDRSFQRSS